MSKYFTIPLLFLILCLFSFWHPLPSSAYDPDYDSTIVHLQVDNCNNNGICEPLLGENYMGCPLDCVAPTSTPPTPTSTPEQVVGGTAVAPLTGGFQNPNAIDLRSVTIIVSSNSAIISWRTYGEALSLLSWGRTVDGELGTISEINFGKTHKIVIENLHASTRYFFQIQSKSRYGNIINFGPQGFVTEAEISLPENLRDFNFDLIKNAIRLSWKNPTAKNFRSTRILRSENFYPIDPEDGEIIYEGRGVIFDDRAIKEGGDYYYSAFAQDQSNNFSSGSILHVRLKDPANSSSSPNPRPSSSGYVIVPLDFYIEQDKKQISFENNIAHVGVGPKAIKISISPESLPENVRYFIINVEDENTPGTFHSYLLRHVNDVSVFETILPGFAKEGRFTFSVSLLNSDDEEMGRFEGHFEAKKTASPWLRFWQAITSLILAIFQKIFQIFGLH